jgi:hypothetical protein
LKRIYRLDKPRPWPAIAHHPGRPANEDKTVLFLGAGASWHEGVPIQSRLLACASTFCDQSRADIDLPKDWAEIAEFLERLAPGVLIGDRSLEDCLTFLDKADVEQEVVAGTGKRNSQEPRRALLNCIANVLDAAQDQSLVPFLDPAQRAARRNPSPMKRLGEWLTQRAVDGERDRWSIISTNWDTTFDYALGTGDTAPVVDYCTYTQPWERYYRHADDAETGAVADVPSVWKRPLRLPSVKLLKLHGSLNWLWCPTCSRLFVSPAENIGLRGTARGGLTPCRRIYCPECRPSDMTTDTAPLLREVLVTPTMIKRLDMVHLKMIWYNALVEISQARRVVFVGYSAPPADYEVRYMLAKAFASGNRGREVLVVTAPTDADALRQNYQRLIGGTVHVSPDGVEELVDRIVKGTSGL